MSWLRGLQLAGFQVITTGRFWVIPEGSSVPHEKSSG
jgi:hypothetical protein